MFPAPKRYHRSELHLYQNCAGLAKSAAKEVQFFSCASYTRARFAAGSTADLPRLPRHCCHATSIGAATAIEEYVPIRMPTTSANEKPCSTLPPNTNNESTVRNVS